MRHIEAHVEQALELLLEQFKGSPKLAGLLRAYIGQVQNLEDLLHTLLSERTLETAVGEQLDVLGRIVNQSRGSLDDDGYRVWLRARIALNRSSGTPEDVMGLMTRILPGQTMTLLESFPAAFILTLVEPVTPIEATQALALIDLVKPIGVQSILIYTVDDGSTTFQFASGDTEEVDADAGFAPDDQSVGGSFTDVV
jgi:hypothetical protein